MQHSTQSEEKKCYDQLCHSKKIAWEVHTKTKDWLDSSESWDIQYCCANPSCGITLLLLGTSGRGQEEISTEDYYWEWVGPEEEKIWFSHPWVK